MEHLAGMRKSEFVVAMTTGKDAPIGEVTKCLIATDLKESVPALTEKLKSL